MKETSKANLLRILSIILYIAILMAGFYFGGIFCVLAIVTILAISLISKHLFYKKHTSLKPDERDYSIAYKASYITMNIMIIGTLLFDYSITGFKGSDFVVNHNLAPISDFLSFYLCIFIFVYFVVTTIIKKKGDK